MNNWYVTKENETLFHRDQAIETGKKIFLTEDQASLHGDKIEPCDSPAEEMEVGVKSEWAELKSEVIETRNFASVQKSEVGEEIVKEVRQKSKAKNDLG